MGHMTETSWERLYRIAEARREQLGMSRNDLHGAGGPSTETLRNLRTRTGAPTVRQRAALDSLDQALGWNEGTAWDLAQPAREAMNEAFLADEEDRLIHQRSTGIDPHEQAIQDMGTMVMAALRKQQPGEEYEQMMVALMKVINGQH